MLILRPNVSKLTLAVTTVSNQFEIFTRKTVLCESIKLLKTFPIKYPLTNVGSEM